MTNLLNHSGISSLSLDCEYRSTNAFKVEYSLSFFIGFEATLKTISSPLSLLS